MKDAICVFAANVQEIRARKLRTGSHVAVLTAPHQLMGSVVGYSLNRGALACGVVPAARDMGWLRRHVLRDDRPSWRVLAVSAVAMTMPLVLLR